MLSLITDRFCKRLQLKPYLRSLAFPQRLLIIYRMMNVLTYCRIHMHVTLEPLEEIKLQYIYKILQGRNLKKMNVKFREFQKNWLWLSPVTYNSIDELRRKKPIADIYCTGSDQVWGRVGARPYDSCYFLDFLDKNDFSIAYGPSFGAVDIPDCLEKNITALTKSYNSILVREESAVEILRKNGIKSKRVLDPVLMLNSKEWESKCNTKLNRKGYILVYQLRHDNKEIDRAAKKIAKKEHKKIIRISASSYYRFKTGRFVYLPDPATFLAYFKNADYVLTDSFHGMCFSIVFRRNFVNVLPSTTGTRILELARVLNIEGRLGSNADECCQILNSNIDYEKLYHVLKSEQESSMRKLTRILNI